MSRLGTKLLLACLLICFGVFYGVDMATNGIERVNGPIHQEPASNQKETVQSTQKNEEKLTDSEKPLQNEFRPVASDTMIHRFADKTGRLIQITVQNGVEIVVSLFEEVIY